MAKKIFEALTETMFYVLMALRDGAKCGVDIAAWVEGRTKGRISMGPGTLYTILAKFEDERVIREVGSVGRRRIYEITEKGSKIYLEELDRLRKCIADAES